MSIKVGAWEKGVGFILDLTPEEELKLLVLVLREENPSCPNTSYVLELFHFSSRVVFQSFISQWFLKAEPHSCQLFQPMDGH